MEIVTLGGLLGLGYLVSNKFSQKSNGSTSRQSKEGFIPAARGPDTAVLTQTAKGSSAVGFGPELDMMYKATNGQTYSSEPNPGPNGSAPFNYGIQKPPLAPSPISPGMKPDLQPIHSNTPLMEFRSDGVEQDPQYAAADYVISPLSGERIPSSEFKHNNMQPFFGGRMKQNTNFNSNQGILDAYNGSASLQIKKQEIEPMFDSHRAPYGNPFGMEDNTDFYQSRIDQPSSRKGEKPFEPIRVGPGLKEKFGSTGKGGFQELDVNEIMRPKTSNQLRVETNPKQEYNTPVVPGAHFVGSNSDNPGEVRKYKPDKFYIDETGERFFTTTGALIKETVRSSQILPHTTRPETSVEYTGSASSQDFNSSYVSGSFRSPMTQQYGGAGYRNATLEGYIPADPDTPHADYGRDTYESRANERSETAERGMALNMVPADTGNVTTRADDDARPTRRGETIGAPRIAGTPSAAEGIPMITVWDPKDVARTTVKESTIILNKYGIASPASAPTRTRVYDPEDVARPTQKSRLSNNMWYGPSMSAAQDSIDVTAAQNMRTNPNKEQVARGRRPIGGSGEKAIFTGDPGRQTSQKLDADFINDRTPVVTRPVSITPGAGDIGRTEYRVPLKLDVSRQRNTPEMLSAVENNPLHQSLHKNAAQDDRVLQGLKQMLSKQ